MIIFTLYEGSRDGGQGEMGQELYFTKRSSVLSGLKHLTLFKLIHSTSPETNTITNTFSDSFVMWKSSQGPRCEPHSSFVSSFREIDFVKKEEEMKKVLEEKEAWYREQMESLQERVR